MQKGTVDAAEQIEFLSLWLYAGAKAHQFLVLSGTTESCPDTKQEFYGGCEAISLQALRQTQGDAIPLRLKPLILGGFMCTG